jgi:hypothetical protein
VESTEASLESAFVSEDGAASAVKDDVGTVETDLGQLTASLSVTSSVATQHNAAEVTTATTAAQTVLMHATHAVSAAKGKANSLVGQAHTIGGRADALSEHCE